MGWDDVDVCIYRWLYYSSYLGVIRLCILCCRKRNDIHISTPPVQIHGSKEQPRFKLNSDLTCAEPEPP